MVVSRVSTECVLHLYLDPKTQSSTQPQSVSSGLSCHGARIASGHSLLQFHRHLRLDLTPWRVPASRITTLRAAVESSRRASCLEPVSYASCLMPVSSSFSASALPPPPPLSSSPPAAASDSRTSLRVFVVSVVCRLKSSRFCTPSHNDKFLSRKSDCCLMLDARGAHTIHLSFSATGAARVNPLASRSVALRRRRRYSNSPSLDRRIVSMMSRMPHMWTLMQPLRIRG